MTRTPTARRGEPNHDIEVYVTELASYLRGPARLKARVAEEITTDLESAVHTLTERGLGARDAVQTAVAEIGSAKTVAAEFADELAIAEARRVLRWLLATGPLVGVWWLLLLAPTGWTSHPGQLISAIPIMPALAVAIAAGLLVLATSGSLTRWLPEISSRRAVVTAALVGLVCITADVLVLTTLTVRLTSGSAALPTGLVAVAVFASLTRLPFAIWAATRCLRARQILGAAPLTAR